MTIEQILQKHFNCKKPFLKKRKIDGYICGSPEYTGTSQAGEKAYGKLYDLLSDLYELVDRDERINIPLLQNWLDNIMWQEEH